MSALAPDFAAAEVHPSPNFGERRDGKRPDAIILHYTGMESAEAAEAWLCNPRSAVSAHYLVHDDGRVVQMVREADRAWHAGKSSWRGVTDINSCSIGIEVANPGHDLGYPDFPHRQIEAVIALCRDIGRRHDIAPERVLAHSDVAPGRKIDPGEKFPWRRLAEAGVGHRVEPAEIIAGRTFGPGDTGEAVEHLQAQLGRYGYGLGISGSYDETTRIVVEAFQRHFRPARVDGLADPSTLETLRRLLSVFMRAEPESGDTAGSGAPAGI